MQKQGQRQAKCRLPYSNSEVVGTTKEYAFFKTSVDVYKGQADLETPSLEGLSKHTLVSGLTVGFGKNGKQSSEKEPKVGKKSVVKELIVTQLEGKDIRGAGGLLEGND